MKYLRKFDSVSEMETAAANAQVSFIGLAYDNGTPVIDKVVLPPPTNLVISCSSNTVTISATNATTLEYNTDGSSTYTTYTEPFAITETVTVYAKATNGGGSITASQECQYMNPPTNLVISCSSNTVTISATNATTLEYNTDGSSTYTTYTAPFAITQTVTVYARATNVDGSITTSQVCEYIKPIDYTIPFYIEDVSGSANTIYIKKDNNSAPTLKIEKSTDGETWETMGTTSTTEITATIPANSKLYLRCSTTRWSGTTTVTYYNYFNTASGNFNVGGNINSLLHGSSFNGQTEFPSGVGYYPFLNLFKSNTRIISAQQLLLPATTLAPGCYDGMFSGCASLTSAPALPATTLISYCYQNMFQGCTSLTSAPALPATTLAGYCYQNMFQGCASLTSAPTLPATTMTNHCYENMFQGCTSLTSAPALPATTLTVYCYKQMFNGCTSLNYIKCLATDISAGSCTSNWVQNVASSGTFVKNSSMSSWTTGSNGIPEGWTVQGATN